MKYLSVLCSLVFFSSCNVILGIRKPGRVNLDRFQSLQSKFRVVGSFICDTSYFTKIASINDSLLLQRHAQPLQALYYDANGNNIATFINCNAPGLVNLNWNVNEALSTFPPVDKTYADSIKLDRVLSSCNISYDVNRYFDYTVILFWNRLMGRQTKIFIKAFQRNFTKAGLAKIHVIYINNDNLFSE